MLLACFSCSSQTEVTPKPVEPIISESTSFVKGADIGWLPQMEATGYRFLDQDGTPKDGLQLLKDRGINTVRLRVWVNPSNHKLRKNIKLLKKKAVKTRMADTGSAIQRNNFNPYIF
jgi:arabinogalactan endo-1,4-beta-galactosidase